MEIRHLRHEHQPSSCQTRACHAKHIERVLSRAEMQPLVAERVTTFDLMMALVSAGFALGLTGAAHIAASREPGVVARPIWGILWAVCMAFFRHRRTAYVLPPPSLPESSVRHADIRRRLRSHSLARHSANSFFLIDLSAPNGL